MGLKGYLKGLIRRYSNPKPIQHDEVTSKPKFEVQMVAAKEALQKKYAFGYYVLHIKVSKENRAIVEQALTDLGCALEETDLLYSIYGPDDYYDIYIAGTNEDFGEFIWSLWYETTYPLILFDKSVIDYLQTFPAIYWYQYENLDDFAPTTTQNIDTQINSKITEVTPLVDISQIPEKVMDKYFGFIYCIASRYSYLSPYKVRRKFRKYLKSQEASDWLLEIINNHPEIVKKLQEYNNTVQDTDTESDEFDPDIDELI